MKTELLHSYSSNSLANLSKTTIGQDNYGSQLTFSHALSGSSSSNSNSQKASRKVILAEISKSIFRKKLLFKRFPILSWAKEYNSTKLVADIIAGLTIGFTILPQGLAYASIAGLPPQYGLYSSIVGCFVYLFFGGTKVINIGPTAILAIITLSYTAGKPNEYAVLLCFLTGSVTFLMGLLQLGFIVNFISTPVISGFTSASALTICSTQIKALLGLKFNADGFRDIIFGTVEHYRDVRRNDAILSGICIGALFILQNLQLMFNKCTKSSPKMDRIIWFISTSRSVIVLIVCTIVFSYIGEDSEDYRVNFVGNITAGLPGIRLPLMTTMNLTINNTEIEYSVVAMLKEDSSAFIVIPLLSLMEHITIAKKFAGKKLLDSSQEMISIGLTNILGSFVSSMPVTGSFSRSTVNAASGAESPLGGLVTGSLVILALLFLTPYFYFIPLAALAAVIVCAVIFTVDFGVAISMWKTKKMDLIPWGVTFFASLFVNLEIGILTGVVISFTFLLYYAARPGVQVQRAESSAGNEFVIVSLDRSLVFPSVEYTRYMVLKSGNTWAKGYLPVVIDFHHIQFADFTAAQGIRDLFQQFNEKNHPLILWRTKPSILRTLKAMMENSEVEFRYCIKEEDIEQMIDAIVDEDKPIHISSSKHEGLNPNFSASRDIA